MGAEAGALARAIVAARPLKSTAELVRVIDENVGREKRYESRKHSSATPFQAIRIEVNDEFRAILTFLESIKQYLQPNSRLAIISFHSTEDKFVTRELRKWSRPNSEERLIPLTGELSSGGRLLTSKAIVPSDEEIERNPRSRSSRMRVFQKSNNGSDNSIKWRDEVL